MRTDPVNAPVPPGQSSSNPAEHPEGPFLSLPEVKGRKVPDEFEQCFERVIPHFLLAPELQALFQSGDMVPEQLRVIREAFAIFPDDYERFLNWVRVSREREEFGLSEDAVILAYGLERAKLFLLGMALFCSVMKKPFEWEPRGCRPKTSPGEWVQNAFKVSRAYSGRHAGLAIAAGYAYDVLALVAKADRASLAVTDCISDCVRRGIGVALMAEALARRCHDLRLADSLFGACVLSQIGEATLAALNPGYTRFLARAAGDRLSRSVRGLCEERLFGVTAGLMGGMVCRYSPVLFPLADVIQFLDRPCVLKTGVERDLLHLGAVCSLALNIVTLPSAEQVRTKTIEKLLGPEVKRIGLNTEHVVSVVEELR